MGVCIFIFDDLVETTNWKFVQRIRAHFKPIVDLIFIPVDNDTNRMISIGEDRYLVEYDLQKW